MKVVIVHGTKGCGKTLNAEKFKQAYKCKRVVDDWHEEMTLKDGDLVLTNLAPPFKIKNAQVVSFNSAMKFAK
jgi:hypothetical protein